ncbi:MAG: hypothetical protein DI622_11760 [Chryseobacterium sp.]|nr:MAG: hypothetical protein DI622_11760 [Chryseobacterium sp.]
MMMVLSDILLLNLLRGLRLLKNKEFCVSDFYLIGNYLSFPEKSVIMSLREENCIEVFELGNEFYKFFNLYRNTNFALTELSSVFYAKQKSIPLVTHCEKLADFAKTFNIVVYEIDTALKIINVEQERINFLNSMKIV